MSLKALSSLLAMDAPRHCATKNRVNCGNGGCNKLYDEHVQLLQELHAHQSRAWTSDTEYKNDPFVIELRNEADRCWAWLSIAPDDSHAASPTSTTDGEAETIRNLDVEHLRVQIDISNSLRGLFEVQHRRQAYREAAAGNSSALAHIDADNFPHVPPRVGLSTLPRNISLTQLVDSEDDEELKNNSETANAAGKKRAAPNGDGLAEEGGKRPRTE
ncbi:uncharacterized protein FFUJ_13928 [Fusarium fujikuroi IMI 58289]|uniref:Uncharacterized protein n=1 Tax=Gibberella fujikuroi (strain CBS 195.34 / IMI 58289 / NRRL A-6831) TaxID=1279085 RepID=S0EB25_GIBF5|nr:uncharacterized protein FFUJ_13928 [Fusarium fujikuroi IMI 58289]KLO92392.1 uncharacterized protein LW93_11965 [Fusarium fujikuroi]KLO98834.1 uncharacterized protein LW94_9245 [Fusarium fujikuroi]CCT72074.1 uncharacterized protein FFUJ_13928 [Fusarium fujikuroi IMI 58289]SCO13504.1 uncharacterized protein FFE2_12842 [Fusarium fujikuroi]SCO18170.1 uncharacterized protein FFM5_11765 [Fusarium fujikuroi]